MHKHVITDGNLTPLAAYLVLVLGLILVVGIGHSDSVQLRKAVLRNREVTRQSHEETQEMLRQNRNLVQHNCQLDRVVLAMLSQSQMAPSAQRKEALALLTRAQCGHNQDSGALFDAKPATPTVNER